MNYYNEHDPKAAAWLRELIAAKLIPAGEVDERSITDVRAADLHGFTQCHFFAGIAGWSLALQRAGWPEDRPCWTGSCPCQCYSAAGKGKGVSDHRDLWPVFAALIRECRTPVVLGEQVEAAIGYGWLDRLRTDLEAEGYAVGGIVLGAHSVGAPHRRQRLYWVAKSQDAHGRGELEAGGTRIGRGGFAGGGTDGLDLAAQSGCEVRPRVHAGYDGSGLGEGCHTDRLAIPEHAKRWKVHGPGQNGLYGQDGGRAKAHGEPGTCGEVCPMAEPHGGDVRRGEQRQQPGDGSGRTMADVPSGGLRADRGAPRETGHPDIGGGLGGMVQPDSAGSQQGRTASTPAGHGNTAESASGDDFPAITRCTDHIPGRRHVDAYDTCVDRKGLRNLRRSWLGDSIVGGERRGDKRGLGEGGEQVAQPKNGAGFTDEPCDGCEDAGGVADSEGVGRATATRPGEEAEDGSPNADAGNARQLQTRPVGSSRTGWARCDILPCRDGKARVTEPGVAPLVAGLPRGVVPGCDPGAPGYANATAEARVMRLKGYGNAICVETARAFIEAYLDSQQQEETP